MFRQKSFQPRIRWKILLIHFLFLFFAGCATWNMVISNDALDLRFLSL